MTVPDSKRTVARTARQPSPIGRFLASFIVLAAVGAIGVSWISTRGGVPLAQEGLANLVSWLLSMAGTEAQADGIRIRISGADRPGMVIVLACTGLTEIVLFLAATLAVSVGWALRCAGALYGLLTIIALNVFRLFLLGWLLKNAPSWYEFTHEVVMQLFLIVAILPLWIVWAAWARGRQSRRFVTPDEMPE